MDVAVRAVGIPVRVVEVVVGHFGVDVSSSSAEVGCFSLLLSEIQVSASKHVSAPSKIRRNAEWLSGYLVR